MATALALLCLSVCAQAAGQKSDVKWPDCYCTDSTGQRIEMGETSCLRVGGREYLARCEMSLNNPIWREVGETCVVS